MFIYQNDWKVLPMAAIIAALVTFVVGGGLFVTQEGTLTGSFALVCVCIWNGLFNSIQVVCRERAIVKREHRAGLHITSYILAHMIYQLILCAAQVVIMLVICGAAGVPFPAAGLITGSGILDLGITLLLVTYSSDMMALLVSCIVKNTTTAMTVMPFLLIIQLVFSGGFFQLSGFAQKLTVLTMSCWGLNTVCALGRYNQLPMVTLWNTLFKFKDMEISGTKPVLTVIKQMEAEDQVKEFILWSGSYNQNPAFASTTENVLKGWIVLVIMVLIFAAISVLALKLVDRDKR